MSAFACFIAGSLGVAGLMFLVFPLADAALKFGPPEYFALISLSLVALTFLSSGSFVRAMMMVFFGLLLGTVGLDQTSGAPRFTFGCGSLLDGFNLVTVAMGLFGVTEVMNLIAEPEASINFKEKIKGIFPTWEDWKKCFGPISRSTIIGFLLGILPGAGVIMATFMTYTAEEQNSQNPGGVRQGAIEGLQRRRRPHTAGGAGRHILCLLALAFPGNITMRLLLGALISTGLRRAPCL